LGGMRGPATLDGVETVNREWDRRLPTESRVPRYPAWSTPRPAVRKGESKCARNQRGQMCGLLGSNGPIKRMDTQDDEQAN